MYSTHCCSPSRQFQSIIAASNNNNNNNNNNNIIIIIFFTSDTRLSSWARSTAQLFDLER